jgi:hypothetical protein
MPEKTAAGTNGAGSDGSIRLNNSTTDGSRQAFRPPVVRLVHSPRALPQMCVVVAGDFSHTSPVSLSRTAWLLKDASTVKRESLGRFLSQFCVTPASASSLTGGAAAVGVVSKPEPARHNPPTSVTMPTLLTHACLMMVSCVCVEGMSGLSDEGTTLCLNTQQCNTLVWGCEGNAEPGAS